MSQETTKREISKEKVHALVVYLRELGDRKRAEAKKKLK